MDDCPRQRADQSCDARDFAGDDSARLRRCGSEEISRIQIWGIFREHGIFGVARRFRNASLVAARNLRIGAAHCMRQPGEPDARPRQCTRSEEHTSELQSRRDNVCRLLLEKKKSTESYPAQPPETVFSIPDSDQSLVSGIQAVAGPS